MSTAHTTLASIVVHFTLPVHRATLFCSKSRIVKARRASAAAPAQAAVWPSCMAYMRSTVRPGGAQARNGRWLTTATHGVPPSLEPLRRPQRPPAAVYGSEFAALAGSRPLQAGGGSSRQAAAAAAAARGAASGAAAASEAEEVLKLVGLLPSSVRQRLEAHPDLPLLLEVVMDLGRPPLVGVF